MEKVNVVCKTLQRYRHFVEGRGAGRRDLFRPILRRQSLYGLDHGLVVIFAGPAPDGVLECLRERQARSYCDVSAALSAAAATDSGGVRVSDDPRIGDPAIGPVEVATNELKAASFITDILAASTAERRAEIVKMVNFLVADLPAEAR